MFSILYVDDEPDLLEICKLFLEKTGEFTVSTFESGGDALATLARLEFDAIVSDYQMPEMTGIELLKTVRANNPDIPFILFTGRGREEVVIEAINNGADFYLQKGGDPRAQFAELAHKLRQAIGRSHAEKALSDSQKRLTDIIDFLPDATFAIDTEGMVIAWNHAIEEMTGVLAKDMLGKGEYEYALPFYGRRRPILIDLIFEPDEKVTEFYTNLRREGNVLSAETDLPHPKGTRIFVIAKASPLYTRNGDIAGAIESIRDISDRRKTEDEMRALNEQLRVSEEELRTSEAKYRTLFERSRDAMLLLDNNVFIDCNAATLAMLGMKSKDEFTRLHPSAISPPRQPDGRDSHEKAEEMMAIALRDGSHRFEWVHRRMNGEIFWAEVSLTAIPIGGRLLLHTVWSDITERKRAEDELRAAYEQITASEEELRSQLEELVRIQQEKARSEENFRVLVDNAPDAIYIQTNNRFRYLNNAALRLFGAASADQLLGTGTFDRIHPSFHERLRERVRDLTVNLQPVDLLDEIYVRLDGTPVDVEVHAVPYEYESQHGALVMVRDISARKRTAADLQAANEQLAAAEEELRKQFNDLAENEARFRTIFENSPYPIVLNDRTTRKYLAVNEAFLLENGFTREEVLGKDSLEIGLIPPEDQATVVNLLQTKNRVHGLPVTIHRKNGSVSHILISALPVMFHDEPAILTMTADITELEQTRDVLKARLAELEAAQAALGERTRQLEEIAATVPGVVYQYYVKADGTDGFSYINRRSGREIFGADDSIVDFLAWFTDHVHPDDRARFTESNQAVVAEKSPWNFEGRFIKPSGEEIWFSGTSCPVEHENEIVFTGLLTDITKQKKDKEQLHRAYEKLSASEEELREQYDSLARSGEALREREEKYRLLVEVTGTGYVILDKEGRVIDANPEYVRITGYADRTDLIGRSVLEWTSTNDRVRNAEAVRQCLAEKRIFGFETTYMDLSGRLIPVEINASVVTEGGSMRIIALTRDISARKATEQALKTSEIRYRTLVENSHDIIFTLDREGIFTFVSPSVTPLLGYVPSDLVGKSYKSVVYPEDISRCEIYLEESLAKSDPRAEIEYRIFHADQSIRLLAANISPVTDEKGDLLFVVGAARDISDLKRSQLAMQEASKKLNLLNNITRHDVANQLTTLVGYTQLAMMSKPPAVVADFLSKIEAAANTIQRQIDFTRAYQELGVTAPTWQRIGDLVRNAEQKALPVTCTCSQYEVHADPMLSKVFFNLFDNAIRHGEHATKAKVRCEIVSDELVIYVEDNGVGIPLDEKPKLFRKGYGRNTGFGLFLAREILAITGISIHETGMHGKGACFEITVPKGAFRLSG